MDQRIRLIAAATVMLVGIGLSLCFRRAAGDAALTPPVQNDLLAAAKQAAKPLIAPEPPDYWPRAVAPAAGGAMRPERTSPPVVTASEQAGAAARIP